MLNLHKLTDFQNIVVLGFFGSGITVSCRNWNHCLGIHTTAFTIFCQFAMVITADLHSWNFYTRKR